MELMATASVRAVGWHDRERPATAHASHIRISGIQSEAIIVVLTLGSDWLFEFGAADPDLDLSAALGEHADLDCFV
jgi:hypothetical protein